MTVEPSENRITAVLDGNGAVTGRMGTPADSLPASGPPRPSQQDINYVVALQTQMENAQLRSEIDTVKRGSHVPPAPPASEESAEHVPPAPRHTKR